MTVTSRRARTVVSDHDLPLLLHVFAFDLHTLSLTSTRSKLAARRYPQEPARTPLPAVSYLLPPSRLEKSAQLSDIKTQRE